MSGGGSTTTPASYLDSEERVLPLKNEASPTSVFVACVNTPGEGVLELLNSVRQNVNIGYSSLRVVILNSKFCLSDVNDFMIF